VFVERCALRKNKYHIMKLKGPTEKVIKYRYENTALKERLNFTHLNTSINQNNNAMEEI
jgi:hypothetical protein